MRTEPRRHEAARSIKLGSKSLQLARRHRPGRHRAIGSLSQGQLLVTIRINAITDSNLYCRV